MVDFVWFNRHGGKGCFNGLISLGGNGLGSLGVSVI